MAPPFNSKVLQEHPATVGAFYNTFIQHEGAFCLKNANNSSFEWMFKTGLTVLFLIFPPYTRALTLTLVPGAWSASAYRHRNTLQYSQTYV